MNPDNPTPTPTLSGRDRQRIYGTQRALQNHRRDPQFAARIGSLGGQSHVDKYPHLHDSKAMKRLALLRRIKNAKTARQLTEAQQLLEELLKEEEEA